MMVTPFFPAAASSSMGTESRPGALPFLAFFVTLHLTAKRGRFLFFSNFSKFAVHLNFGVNLIQTFGVFEPSFFDLCFSSEYCPIFRYNTACSWCKLSFEISDLLKEPFAVVPPCLFL